MHITCDVHCTLEEEIETDSKLQKTLEPKGNDKVAASEVIADALLAVVGEGFSVQKREGEGEESNETRPDKEKQADASQEEEKGMCATVIVLPPTLYCTTSALHWFEPARFYIHT